MSAIAFSSARKRMAVVARDAEGRLWSFVKGSPEVVAALATNVLVRGAEEPLDAQGRERLLATAHSLGESGYRVLALAYRRSTRRRAEAAEEALTWAGLVGLIDPPRANVRGAIEAAAWRRHPHRHGHRGPEGHGDGRGATTLAIAGPGDLCLDSAELAQYLAGAPLGGPPQGPPSSRASRPRTSSRSCKRSARPAGSSR